MELFIKRRGLRSCHHTLREPKSGLHRSAILLAGSIDTSSRHPRLLTSTDDIPSVSISPENDRADGE